MDAHGGGPDSLVQQIGLPQKAKLLIYQGGLSPNRNLENLVRSMAYVRNAEAVLIILGNGEFKGKLLELVRKGGLAHKVFLIPGVPQKELLRVTTQATLGIIPYFPNCLNTLYCTPNKLFEYIAAGVPLLVNDLPELRKIVEAYDVGWVAGLTTPERIAAAIDVALSRGEYLERFRKNAARAFESLCWEEEEKKLASLYERL
jgi:glycosyltransferase involved in cell wall biosynthesis